MTLKTIFLIAFLIVAISIIVIFIPHPKDQTEYALITAQYGNFTQAQEIEVNFDNSKDLAMATLPKSTGSNIKQNQNVILYDKDDNVLPLGGKIAIIRQAPEVADILIALPKETDTDLLSNRAAIVTMDIPTLKVLPHSVVQQDKEGHQFIWTAEVADNKYIFKRQDIDIIYENDDYITLGQILPEQTLIVGNPDDKITEDKKFMASVVVFDPPKYNPIYTAWQQYVAQTREDQQAEMAQNLENCLKAAKEGKNPSMGAQSSENGVSCGASSGNSIISAEEIFANIGKDGQGGSACGSNACGQ